LTRPLDTVSDLFSGWRLDVLSDEPPATWSIGDPAFAHVEVAPGRIVLAGGRGVGPSTYCVVLGGVDVTRRGRTASEANNTKLVK
jgi:hypothetical protein